MKRILSFILLILALCTTASAQSDIFKKCENEKNITTVYISKAMLQMVGDGKMGKIDPQAMRMLKDKIDKVLIINADNVKGIEFLKSLRKDLADRKDCEVLMQINDPDSDMRLYCSPLSQDKNQYAISVFGGSHATTIVIEGSLTLDEIVRVTEGMGNREITKAKKSK